MENNEKTECPMCTKASEVVIAIKRRIIDV